MENHPFWEKITYTPQKIDALEVLVLGQRAVETLEDIQATAGQGLGSNP